MFRLMFFEVEHAFHWTDSGRWLSRFWWGCARGLIAPDKILPCLNIARNIASSISLGLRGLGAVANRNPLTVLNGNIVDIAHALSGSCTQPAG